MGVGGRAQLVQVAGGQAGAIAMAVLSGEMLDRPRNRDKEICWWTTTLDTNKRKDAEKTLRSNSTSSQRLNFTLEKKIEALEAKPNQNKTKLLFSLLGE